MLQRAAPPAARRRHLLPRRGHRPGRRLPRAAGSIAWNILHDANTGHRHVVTVEPEPVGAADRYIVEAQRELRIRQLPRGPYRASRTIERRSLRFDGGRGACRALKSLSEGDGIRPRGRREADGAGQ